MGDIENYDWMGLLKATIDVTKNGFIDDEIAEQRYEHCKGCIFFKPESKQCKKCGCIMNVKVKVKGATCPIGMW